MSNKTPPVNHDISEPWWGLSPTVTPCLGARLVQEGNQLHYLADRSNITGTFSDADLRHLDQAFPVLMKQLGSCWFLVSSLLASSTVSRCMPKS